ncbi:hypothetical protein L3V83_07470 [Thiotrichales bacterium 19X7-9]|nr:hypothetical protein [Thiotrichales bacterium 19X7-9]
MKIIIKKCILIIGFAMSASLYAGTTFNFTLKNSSDYSVKLTEGSWKCIMQISNFPYGKILYPNNEFTFQVKDDGGEGNGCEGDEKHFTIYYQFLDDNNEQFGDKKEVEWKHYKKSGDWGFIVNGDTKGSLVLNSANCDNKDCKNKWVSGNDGDQFIETTDGFGKYVAIGLGDVNVTDGIGKPLDLTEVDLSSTDDIYIFHFSKTQEVCRYANKLITCDNGVGSIFRNESYVFFCRQADGGDSACPWTSVSEDTSNYYSNVNIY